MTAVQDQRRQLEKWRSKFTPTVTRQLNNLFIHLVSLLCVHSYRTVHLIVISTLE